MNERTQRIMRSLIAAPFAVSVFLFASCGSKEGGASGQTGGSPDERILPVQVQVARERSVQGDAAADRDDPGRR